MKLLNFFKSIREKKLNLLVKHIKMICLDLGVPKKDYYRIVMVDDKALKYANHLKFKNPILNSEYCVALAIIYIYMGEIKSDHLHI